MNVILFGLPGSGKGTVSKKIEELLGIPHLSQGDLLRKEMESGSEYGKEIRKIITKLKYVPNDISSNIVFKEVEKHPNGFILDGFPRSIKQNKLLEMYLEKHRINIDKIIHLDVQIKEIKERITNRKRMDDDAENLEHRIKKYLEYTKPLIDFYQNDERYYQINGSQSKEKVLKDVLEIIR